MIRDCGAWREPCLSFYEVRAVATSRRWSSRSDDSGIPPFVESLAARSPSPTMGGLGQRVFISHANEDRSSGQRILEYLCERGFEAWMDSQIQPGTSWSTAISAQLRSAEAVVVLISSAAINRPNSLSSYFHAEVTEAINTGKVLVPVSLDGSIGGAIDPRLNRIQHLSLAAGDPEHPGWQRLGISLKHSASVAQPTVIESFWEATHQMFERWRRRFALEEVFPLQLHVTLPRLRPLEEELLRGSARQSFDIQDWLQRTPRLVILGDAGTGKTTILHEVLRRVAAQEAAQRTRLAFYLTLRGRRVPEHRNNIEIVLGLIHTNLVDDLGLRHLRLEDVDRLISDNDCLFLFDGLNEAPEGQVHAWVETIASFAANPRIESRGHQFVFASRFHTFKHSHASRLGATVLEIERLDSREVITNFIAAYTGQPELAPALVDELWRHQASRSMAQTPGLLALMILLYRKHGRVPPSRALLLKTLVDGLLGDWSLAAGRANYSLAAKLAAASAIALAMRTEGLEMAWDKAIGEVKAALPADGVDRSIADELSSPDEAEALLKEICQDRLLERTHRGVYFRLHPLQEYLAALRLLPACRDPRAATRGAAARQYVRDPQWHEILALAVGLVEESDPPTAVRFIESLGRRNELLAARCVTNLSRSPEAVVRTLADRFERRIWRHVDSYPSIGFLAALAVPLLFVVGIIVMLPVFDRVLPGSMKGLLPFEVPTLAIYVLIPLTVWLLYKVIVRVGVMVRGGAETLFEGAMVTRVVQPALRGLLLLGTPHGQAALGRLQARLRTGQAWQSRRGRATVVNALLIVLDPLDALEDPDLRVGAILVLGEHRERRAIPKLVGLLHDRQRLTAMSCVESLFKIARDQDKNSAEFAAVAAALEHVATAIMMPWTLRRAAFLAVRNLGRDIRRPRLFMHLLARILRPSTMLKAK